MAAAEWTTQAIISFGERSTQLTRNTRLELTRFETDGGGIRGYGSLLILRALMEKVGIEERRMDPAVKSSFSPGMYKPTKIGFRKRYTENVGSYEASTVTETDPSGLSNDALFLPCHYFDYGAGTSTGGFGNDVTRFAES